MDPALLIIVLFALLMFGLHSRSEGMGGHHRHVEHGRQQPRGAAEAESHSGRGFRHVLLMVLACILPLFLFFGLGAAGFAVAPGLLWLILIACGAMLFLMLRSGEAGGTGCGDDEAPGEAAAAQAREEALIEEATTRVAGVFDVRGHERDEGVLTLYGRLLAAPEVAHARLEAAFADIDIAPLLQEDDAGRPAVVLAPRDPRRQPAASPTRPLLHLALLAATLVTTIWAGAAHQGLDLLAQPGHWTAGVPYAAGLMLILGIHELGHYFAARAHGMRVSLPYFIPVPFALGTFGAFIQMKSTPRDRRVLFDVGVAGPLAGLAVAVPALLLGLQNSVLLPGGSGVLDGPGGGASLGSSVLLAVLAKLALGTEVGAGHRILLHPLAFAGWLGLMLTALNLLPVGQLDGGHISHALLGRRRADTLGTVALFGLVLLGLFVWSGLLTWALIVFFLAGTKTLPPANDLGGLGWRRTAVGVFAFTVLALILTPLPHALYQDMGIHCPYL